MKYSDFLHRKKVCFVGGSPILIGKGMGEYIDSFDIVVRTNGSINLIESEQFSIDYGKKTDILYTNHQFYRESSPLPIIDYQSKGLHWMCMKACGKEDMKKFSAYLGCRTIHDTIKEVTKIIPSATMGAFIFADILKCKPKNLYITGIDFFSSKKAAFEHNNYQEYFPGYLPEKVRIQGNVINKNKKEDGHNFIGNANYIYKLWKDNPNMVFPEFIANLLIDIVNGEVTQK